MPEPTPYIPDWKETPLKRNPKIPLLVKQRASLAAKIKELEAQRKEIGENLQALLVKYEVDAVAIEGYTPLRIVTQNRSKVDEGKVKFTLINKYKVPPAGLAAAWEEATFITTSSFITGGSPSGSSAD